MKFITTLLLLCATATLLTAQKIKIKKGVVSVDKVAMYKVESDRSPLTQDIGAKDHKFYNLDGDLLVEAIWSDQVDVSQGQYGYKLLFPERDMMRVGVGVTPFSARKSLAKLLIKNGILTEGKTDIAAAVAYAERYGRPVLTNAEAKERRTAQLAAGLDEEVDAIDKPGYTLVERDKSLDVSAEKDGEFRQGFTPIGRYKLVAREGTKASYTIDLLDGTAVATVQFEGGNAALEATIITHRDDASHEIDPTQMSKQGFGAGRDVITLKRVAVWLVDNGYL